MRNNIRSWSALAAAAVIVTVLAGCTSTVSNQSDPNSHNSVSGSGVAGAKAYLKQVTTESASAEKKLIPTSSPAVGSNKKIVVVLNGQTAEGSVRASEGMKAAAKVLGWTIQIVDGQQNANVQGQAVLSAISAHADGIVLMSIDPQSIGGAVTKALTAKIPVVTGAVPNSPTSTPGIFADVSNSSYDGGLALAAWIASASNGKAKIVNVPDSSVSLTVQRADGVAAGIKKFCGSCDVALTQKNDIANMPTTLPSLASSAVQKFGTKDLYIIAPFDAAVPFLVQGLKDSNAPKSLPIVSMDGNAQELQMISNHDYLTATWAASWEWVGWGILDEMNRAIDGSKAATESAPSLLITAANAPAPGKSWTPKFNYEAAYTALWGK